MNSYIPIVEEAINYIEQNITEKLAVSSIARQLHVSEYHFCRVFSFMIGISPKKYVLGRKLTDSLKLLSQTNQSIINIALNYSFEYPEVYSRAFKKHFGMSPSVYRSTKPQVKTVGIASVISRDIVNFKGQLTLKSDYIYQEKLHCYGYYTVININDKDSINEYNALKGQFLEDTKNIGWLHQTEYNTTVKCLGNNKDFGFFIYKESKQKIKQKDLVHYPILQYKSYEASWYVKFNYEGELQHIQPSFEEDILGWIEQKKERLSIVESGMFLKQFDIKGLENQVQITVRIKRQM